MVRAIERIEQDILALEQAIAGTSEELYSAYDSYLSSLGQAVRQQVIMASYYLCTQGYPDQFLQLPFSQRQQLQQDLQQLAHQIQQALRTCLTTIAAEAEGKVNSGQAKASPLESLGHWQVQLEAALVGQLRLGSRKANQRLAEAGILPEDFSEPVLEAALKSEMASEMMPSPPNILNFIVEAELPAPRSAAAPSAEESTAEAEAESAFPVRMIALRLRLADIEFADSLVLAGRTQIRHLVVRLGGLEREYLKKQQERAIAAAEAAWRASWTEEL